MGTSRLLSLARKARREVPETSNPPMFASPATLARPARRARLSRASRTTVCGAGGLFLSILLKRSMFGRKADTQTLTGRS
jgi:hypothetical protein